MVRRLHVADVRAKSVPELGSKVREGSFLHGAETDKTKNEGNVIGCIRSDR